MIKNNWKHIVTGIIAVIVGIFGVKSHLVGAVPTPTTETSMYISDPTYSLGSQGLTVGTNGTTAHTVLAGVCTSFTGTTTIAATSSLTMSCSVPNLPASSTLAGAYTMEVTSPANNGNIFIIGSSASTTGYLAFTLMNLSGAATSSYSEATSGIDYQITF